MVAVRPTLSVVFAAVFREGVIVTELAPRPIEIDVWSDIACPWCYIGKRRLEAGLAEYAGATTRSP